MEREGILKNSKSIMPAAFVSFNSRCGAAVCAQTQQSKNPTLWLTNWAPEPRDVYWNNLSISFFSLSLRKLLISVAVFALVFFYMIPITFVQSLGNLEGLEKVAPFLRPLIEWKIIKSFLQGFLPGLALKVFLLVLPAILMFMSKIEGHVALSVLERRTAAKYYYFMLVNVFLGSIVAGTAFQQLHAFLFPSPISYSDETEVLPPNTETTGAATIAGAPSITPHGIEIAVEFKPVEHPTEPLHNDRPIQCPIPEPSLLNDGRIWKERVSAVRRRANIPVMQEGTTAEPEAAGTRPRPPMNRVILPSISSRLNTVSSSYWRNLEFS